MEELGAGLSELRAMIRIDLGNELSKLRVDKSTKLTRNQVRLIRASRDQHAEVLAERFGVSAKTIREVWRHATWREVEDA